MASRTKKSLSLSLVVSCMFILSFLSCSVSASRTYPSDSDANDNNNNNKVKLGVYFESLCPDSVNFIINYLVKLFEDDALLSVVDLHLSPWGNANLRGNSTFDCQHGPSECLLNTVEACAIDAWPDQNEHFKYIYCVETLVYENKYSQWETCFEKLGLDPKPVADCYSGGCGTELELKYAAETNSLVPPHKYVPWVVVDGQPLYEDYENFISYICKAYKGKGNGKSMPKACNNVSLTTTMDMGRAEPIRPAARHKETAKLYARIRSTIMSWIRNMNTAASM